MQVSSDGFGWTFSVPVRRVDQALDLLADVVQRPTLLDDAVETERAIAAAQVAQLRDDMFRYPVRLATEVAFGAHPYARSLIGTEGSLAAIDGDRVREWHRTHVLTAPTVIAIVGDVEPDDLAALAARAFGTLVGTELEPLAAPVWPSESRVAVEQREKAQTALAILFPSPSRGDDARFAAELVAGVASGLGGRFFDELRDRRSLAYTVQAWSTERVQAGTFGTYIATSPEKEEAAREGLLREFARLREDRVTDEELQRAQTYAIGTHAISRQSGATVLAELVDAWSFGTGLGELETYEARIRAVTADGMRAMARAWLDDGRRVEGIVRGTGRAV